MSHAAPHLATRGVLPGTVQNRFYKKQGGARELLVTERKGLFWARVIFSVGKEKGKDFCY